MVERSTDARHSRLTSFVQRRSSLATNHWPLATLNAFTLIELLIVLAIISLIVGLGIPLFNVLTGSRSVEAGRNVVAATIGQARTIAVNEGRTVGVLFYIDPATERTAMSIVIVRPKDPDPYDKYKTWVAGQEYQSGNDNPDTQAPTAADRVIALTSDANTTFKGSLYKQSPAVTNYLQYFGNYRPTVLAFNCVQPHDTSAVANRPSENGPYGSYGGSSAVSQKYQTIPSQSTAAAPTPGSTRGPFANSFWDPAVTVAIYGERVLLPNGVGLQVIIPPQARFLAERAGVGVPPADMNERYLRTACIMFDPQGRLTVQNDVQVGSLDVLGKSLGLQGNARIISGIGVALYDRRAFKSYVTPSGSPTSECDWVYQADNSASGNAYVIQSTFTNIFADYDKPGNSQEEVEEEQWLDNNSTPLLINRYSGALSETD